LTELFLGGAFIHSATHNKNVLCSLASPAMEHWGTCCPSTFIYFYASANYSVVVGSIMFLERSCVCLSMHLCVRAFVCGLWARISLECMEISASGKQCYQLWSLLRWTKKNSYHG